MKLQETPVGPELHHLAEGEQRLDQCITPRADRFPKGCVCRTDWGNLDEKHTVHNNSRHITLMPAARAG